MHVSRPWRKGSAQTEKPLILIVEDDVWMRFIAGALLEEEGFAIARAADGQAGLGMAERLHPAVILLDPRLPKASGSEFLTRLRSQTGLQGTPVIVLRNPVDVAELIEQVHEASGREHAGRALRPDRWLSPRPGGGVPG